MHPASPYTRCGPIRTPCARAAGSALLVAFAAVHVAPAAAAAPAAPSSVESLLADTGLRASPTPSRDLPGWRPPTRIYVDAREIARIPRLQAVAPGVQFVPVTPGEVPPPADASIGVCTRDALAASPDLVWIQVSRHGADACVGVPGVRERRIAVTVMSGMAAPPVADHAMALLLSHSRALPSYAREQALRRWTPLPPSFEEAAELRAAGELRGRTLLIVGLGGIGTEIAKRARGFDLRILGIRASSREGPDYVAYVGLPDELARLAAEADYVINVLPLTPATRRIFDDGFFAALRPGAYFINVGRGESVDQDALLRALRTGRLAGAALDVADPEPLPPEHPLWSAPNVTLTMHKAGFSRETYERRWRIAEENLRRYVAGEPLLGVIDVARGY